MASPVTRPRRVALDALRSVRHGDLADRALDRAGAGLEPRDFAWTQELVYGVVRLRGRIDYLLAALVRGGIGSLDPDVLDVLRLGAYQLVEMGGVAPYAAVSQSVELVRWAKAPRAAGLVNGVLQSLLRRRSGIPYPDPATDLVQYLCTWGSHPRWLIDRWVARWGAEETIRLVEANNRRPELFVRPVAHTAAEAIGALRGAGVEAEPVELSPDSVRVLSPSSARDALAVVPAVVQDPAAALVVRYAAAPASAKVIDLCAAPGGKAVGLAAAADYVVAADLSAGRLRRVRENAARVGIPERVGAVVADGRTPPFRPVEMVLLDAPCTGTGTFRRHPDGRWRVTEEDLSALCDLQRALLDSAAQLVAPNGLLVYSTCSLEPEENELLVADFLARHPTFERDPGAACDPVLLTSDGDLAVLPQRCGFDGSYAARLRRAA